MFDLRKISRTPFFDLRKKNQAFWGKKGNFWQKMLKLKLFFFLITKKTWKNCTWHPTSNTPKLKVLIEPCLFSYFQLEVSRSPPIMVVFGSVCTPIFQHRKSRNTLKIPLSPGNGKLPFSYAPIPQGSFHVGELASKPRLAMERGR